MGFKLNQRQFIFLRNKTNPLSIYMHLHFSFNINQIHNIKGFFLHSLVYGTFFNFFRFATNWEAGDTSDNASKTIQESFKESTNLVFSNHQALNLKGQWAFGELGRICKKTGWWSESPPHPIHCLRRNALSKKSADKSILSNLLQILSEPI